MTALSRVLSRRETAAPLAAGGLSFAIYLASLAPTMTGFDAGDLITASWTQGVAHPPGYPLYILVGRTFGLLLAFVPDVAQRYNLLSAVCAAGALALLAYAVVLFTRSGIAAVAAALVLATAPTFWAQAIVAEVYALHALLVAAILVSIALWHQRADDRYLVLAAYLCGLGLAHHLTIVLCLPAMVFLILLSSRRAAAWRQAPFLVLLLALPALLYAVLLVHAQQGAAYDFGHPATWSRLRYQMSGGIYHNRLHFLGVERWLTRLPAAVASLGRSAGPLLVIGALFGLTQAKKEARASGAIAILVLVFVLYATSYRVPDIAVVYIPVHLGLAVVTAAGMARLVRAMKRHRIACYVSCVGLIAVPLVYGGFEWRQTSLRNATAPREYLLALGNTATAGGREPAILCPDGDTELFGLFYFKLVENRWPRLTLIDRSGMLGPDLYGVRTRRVAESVTGTTLRDSIEERYFGSINRPLFFTSAPTELPTGYATTQVGPLFLLTGTHAAPPASLRDPWRYTPPVARCRAAVGGPPAERYSCASLTFRRAVWQLDRGHKSEADALAALSGRLWDAAEMHGSLARYYVAAGDTAAAFRESRRAVQVAAVKGDALLWQAELLLSVGDSMRAVAVYGAALKEGVTNQRR